MKKALFYLFSFLSLGIHANEQDTSLELINKANKAYENGTFEVAVESYSQLLADGYVSKDLHFNYANCLFKSNELALSILHYEKALKLDPSSEDAAYNLKLANNKTVDKIEAIPDLFIYRWWRTIYNIFPADDWAKILIVFFILGLVGLSIFKLAKTIKLKKFGFTVLSGSLILALICWVLAASQKNYATTTTHAIILDSTVDILSAPSSGSSQLFVLHEGTKVKIKDQTEGWLEISLPNGNQGWIVIKSVAKI
jgi:tetratricopeptide (TPR) repeat protein